MVKLLKKNDKMKIHRSCEQEYREKALTDAWLHMHSITQYGEENWNRLSDCRQGLAVVDRNLLTRPQALRMLRSSFVACRTVNWLWADCPDFITKDQWSPNSQTKHSTSPWLEGNAGGLSHSLSKAEDDHWTQGNDASALSQSVSGVWSTGL